MASDSGAGSFGPPGNGLRSPGYNPRGAAAEPASSDHVSAVLRSLPSPTDDPAARVRWPVSRTVGQLLEQVAPVAPVAPRSMGLHTRDSGATRRRTAEILAALSGVLDASEGHSFGHAVRVSLLAGQVAQTLERGDALRASMLYAGLLRDAGTIGRTAIPGAHGYNWSSEGAAHLSKPDRAVAAIRSMGMSEVTAEAVYFVEERWDGKGHQHLRHESIPLGARILAVAVVAATATPAAIAAFRDSTEIAATTLRAVAAALRSQRGHELDPNVVDALLSQAPASFWRQLVQASPAELLLDAEPAGEIRRSTSEQFDTICATFSDLVDTRTPQMGRHGVRMAGFAARVAEHLGFDPGDCDDIRRAALLHDIGKLMVPIAVLEKSSSLSEAERAVIRTHPGIGAEVLRRSRTLANLAPLMEFHHEPLDGTGAFPQSNDNLLGLGPRILAVCDRYEAMTSERPYRPLLSEAQVWHLLEEAALEPQARDAFLALHDVVDEESAAA